MKIIRTEYGCCPVCNGEGKVPCTGTTSSVFETCYYCNGNKSVVTATHSIDESHAEAVKDESKPPSGKEEGLWRWIKASDGFPKLGVEVPVRIGGGKYKCGHWSESDNAFMVYENGTLVRYPPTIYFIEWLSPASTAQEQGYTREAMVELIETFCENLALQLDKKGCCGEGDGKDRKADADDNGGREILHKAKQFLNTLNSK
jgi:hypothetical protein